MMKQVQQIDWADENGHIIMTIAMPSFLTIIMMPFTYSIANGIFFGIGSFVVLSLCTGKWYGQLCRRIRSTKTQKLARESLRKIDRAPLQALIQDKNNTLATPELCEHDMRTSDIVPIVVGACLAALVIIVLVAYLIGRARAKRQGYASV